MRSLRGIPFRLKQELANLLLLAARPRLRAHVQPSPLTGLPDPAPVASALRSSPFALEVARLADSVLAHRFPLLAHTVHTGPRIDWRRDYVHQVSTGSVYFRRIPYLDFSRSGDHKIVWASIARLHGVFVHRAE